MIGNVSIDYLVTNRFLATDKFSDRAKKTAVYIVAAKSILLIVFMSITGQFLPTFYILGVTVYACTSLGYVIDMYHKECDKVTSYYEYIVFCCFFGKIYVGPLVSAQQFIPQMKTLEVTYDKFIQGFVWFCHGFAKKIILADTALMLGNQFKAIPYDEKSALGVWMLVLCYLFATYYTLSGYSDMARGLGALFGINLPENFHYPFHTQSVTQFFSNFNISANRFVRKYIYMALGAEDNGNLPTIVNIMLITMIMGLWYGISPNLLLWGGVLGVFIVIETLYEEKFLYRIPGFIRQVTTTIIIILSFTIFASKTLAQSDFYYRIMFGIGGTPWIDPVSQYLFVSNLIVLTSFFVFSTGFFSRKGRQIHSKIPRIWTGFSVGVNILLLIATVSYLV